MLGGYVETGVPPCSVAQTSAVTTPTAPPRDGPHEREQFAGDGRHGHVGMFAAGNEPTKTLAQAELRLPPDVLSAPSVMHDAGLNVGRHLRGMAICPRGLDERTTGASIPGFGDPTLAARPATRMAPTNEPNEGGELARVVETREIP